MYCRERRINRRRRMHDLDRLARYDCIVEGIRWSTYASLITIIFIGVLAVLMR